MRGGSVRIDRARPVVGAASVAAFLVAALAGAPPSRAAAVAPDVRVNADVAPARALQNADAAVNPTNPQNIVASMENRIGGRCRTASSFDGGRTWAEVETPFPAGFTSCDTFGPATSVAFDAAGILYYLFAATTTPSGGGVVFLARSNDGGLSFGTPAIVSPPDEAVVEPRVLADTSGGPHHGTVYVAWRGVTRGSSYYFSVQVLASRDGGETFSAPVRVNGPLHPVVRSESLAIGSAGEVYVAFLDNLKSTAASIACGSNVCPALSTNEVVVARSTDGGASFPLNATVGALAYTEWAGGTRAQGANTAFQYPSIAVDGSTGHVYTAWYDGHDGHGAVRIARSRDRGETWAAAVAVGDGSGPVQFLPRIAVSAGGRVDVLYYERDGSEMDVMLASSADGATSFAPAARLNSTSMDPGVGPPDLFGVSFGEQLALAESPYGAIAVWTDSRNGTRDSGTQDVYSTTAAP